MLIRKVTMRTGSVKRGVRIIVVVVVLSIAWIQLALPSLPHDPPATADHESLEPDPSLKGFLHMPLHVLMQKLSSVPEVSTTISLPADKIWEIWEHITEFAGSESIQNVEVFGPVQPNTVVIVIQVHNRLNYLRHLIVSLAEVRGIDSVLLIFSHDFYDEAINQLIMNIDFCMVLQVFYPHTLQLHPTSFPGHSPGDCPRDTDRKIAKELQCRGNPDLYGHYREPRYTQTKNHWWWKANKVFDAVLTPLNHSGLVLFLEEDHYVSEDLLHMLTLLSAALPHACPHCSLLTLGNYLKNYNWPGDAKKVEVSPWLSSKHNMGFAFNRTTWQKIKACGVGFCTHDDYNWDWSLQHVSNTCLQQRLHTMVLRAPRVFHIGECGVHHKKKDCSSKLVLNKVYRTLQSGRRALFPLKLIIMQAPPKKIKKHKGNGGWGDHRDQELCKAFLTSTGLFSPLVQEPSPPERPAPRNRTLGAPIHRTNSTSQRPPKDNVFPDILPRTGKSSRDKNPHLSEGGGFKEEPAMYQHGKAARSSSRDKPYLAERGFVARVSSVMREPQVITVSYDGSTDDSSDVAAAVPHYLDPRHPLNPSHYRHDPRDPASLSLQSLSHEASAPGMPLVQQVHSIALSLHHPAIGSESELLRRGHPIAAKEVDESDQVITYEEGRDLRMHRRSIS